MSAPCLKKAGSWLRQPSAAWNHVGVQWRLHLLIQMVLAVFFLGSQSWIVRQFDQQGIADLEKQGQQTADGLINGLNLLMVTGRISDPKNRELLVQKMSSSENIKALRLIRADQVNAQFGQGVPSEQGRDSFISAAFDSGQPLFVRGVDAQGTPTLRAIIPFLASENFRGTNCLTCHQVKSGSVNGVADISLDLSAHEQRLSLIRQWLWSGMMLFQLVLSLLIALFVNVLLRRHVLNPVKQLQATIESIDQSGDLSQRVALEGEHPDIDRMAETFNNFVNSLEIATSEIKLLAKVVESSEEAILITDADMNIVFVNRAFTHITGYREDEVVGKNPRILKSGYQDAHFYQVMWREIEAEGHWKGEIYNRKKNGDIYPEWQSINVVKNARGEVSNYVSIFMDISKRKEAEAHISYMANHDALTGLANRNLLNDRLEQALLCAHRTGTKLAVLFLDLDKFKDINDVYGHAAGDALLRIVAERLKACVREGDTIARQGGDEFILMLPEVGGMDAVAKIAEKLLYSISAPYLIEQQQMFISVSIGIAVYPDDCTEMECLLKNADAAMYSAKQDGRNRYHFFTQDMNAEAARRVRLQSRLRSAVEHDALEVYYQPQLNIKTGEISGVEALLRWNDPEEGFVSPAEFIPIAEESGLIIQLGNWVLGQACQQAKRWHDEGYSLVVSVNVSGRQFKEPDFEASVEAALSAACLAPHYLELEMTEGVLIEKNESLTGTMAKLKSLGVKLALDDFGTGYSSLSYIKRFPIDRIKIDQSFVRDVIDDAEDAAIVDAIIYIAHGLKIEVIAEGVETEEQLNFLHQHQCSDIQGYLISRPVPADQVASLLACKYQPMEDM